MTGTIVLSVGFICWALMVTWAAFEANERSKAQSKEIEKLNSRLDLCATKLYLDVQVEELEKVMVNFVRAEHFHLSLENRTRELRSEINNIRELCDRVCEMKTPKGKESLLRVAPIKVDLTYAPAKNLGGKRKKS